MGAAAGSPLHAALEEARRLSVTHQNLLDAMDGIAMILDAELRIIRVGGPNWQKFFDDNPPQSLTVCNRSADSMLNRPVTQFFAGDALRKTFTDLFNSVISGTRSLVLVDFRCDAPTLRRDMRLSVRPITTKGQARYVLYQSIMVSVQPRPAIPLFSAAVADQDVDHILTLCAICARVAWPIGAPTGAREWIEPPEFYVRGGGDVSLISHGFCEDCFARLQAED
jgi:hypothetical protein